MKLFLALLLISTSVWAESDRPDENELFGDKKAEVKDTKSTDTNAFTSGAVKDNPMEIGGTFYQRMTVSPQQGVGANSTPMSMPLQFDLFLDSKPSDRVRGFVDERILYDATRDSYGNTTSGANYSSLQYSSFSTVATSTSTALSNPQIVLDQAWLKFDIDHTIFVTAGKQHLKWGTARFWNPTDFLNTQIRDPLLTYDLRLGNSMLKLDIPFESQKFNLYAITLFNNPQAASTLGQLGEAFRIEKVIDKTEIGLDAVFRGNVAPAYGADISAGVGPFDVYAEASMSAPRNYFYSVPSTGLSSGTDITSQITATGLSNPQAQAAGGINYQFGWRDNRSATLGFEYFYNQAGYTNTSVYPALIFLGQYQPFYIGKQYGAVYLTAEGPDSEKHTSYTFSVLGNLSDGSYLARLDFSWRFLTYMTFEAFAAYHFGAQGGEFNFSLNTPALTYQGSSIAAISLAPTVVDLGLALRMSF